MMWDEDHDIIVQHEFQNDVLAILSKEQNFSGDEETDEEEEEEEEAEEKEEAEEEEAGGGGTEKEEEIEEKCKEEKHSETPDGEKSSNSAVESVETEETTQKETIVQQEKESTDNHTVNSSSENTHDQKTEGIGRKKFSLFKRKPPTCQKKVCSRMEDRSGKPLQSEEKEKEDLSGEGSKDENQNHTLEDSRETVTNQDRRMKSSTCILL